MYAHFRFYQRNFDALWSLKYIILNVVVTKKNVSNICFCLAGPGIFRSLNKIKNVFNNIKIKKSSNPNTDTAYLQIYNYVHSKFFDLSATGPCYFFPKSFRWLFPFDFCTASCISIFFPFLLNKTFAFRRTWAKIYISNI